jgi:hypothetical protein
MVQMMKRAVFFLLMAMLSVDAATVSGVVKDSASGTPLTGIYVSFRTTSSSQAFARDTTDATGAYSLTTDSVGTFILRARDLAAGSLYSQKDSSVAIAATDAKTIDIMLAKTPSATVSGMIGDEASSGSPIAGATVQLRSTSYGGATLKDTTGADGKYEISVPTGSFILSASAAHYVTKTLSDTIKVTTSDPITKNIDLTAIVYGSVSGMIGDEASSGSPITGAIVTLRQAVLAGALSLKDTTAADGKYQFDSVPTGNYILTATTTGYVPYTSDTVKITSSEPVTKNIDMSLIVYTTISGMIGDEASSGSPINGAFVLLRSSGMTSKRDTTAADGKYQFDSVPTGNYTLSASATGYVTDTLSDTIKVTSADQITKNLNLRLRVYATVSGTVTDTASNAAIANAIVTIRINPTREKKDTTGADGKYSIDSVENGRYSISVSAANYFAKTDTLEISGTTFTADLQLLPVIYVTVSGTLTDSDGKPVANAFIMFSRGSRTKLDTSASDGKYSIDSVTSGKLTITWDQYVWTFPLTVLSASAKTMDITLNKLGILFNAYKGLPARPTVGISSNGSLCLSNFLDAGSVRLFNMSGRQIYVRNFAAFQTHLELPLKGRIASGRYTISITQKNSVFRSRILVP